MAKKTVEECNKLQEEGIYDGAKIKLKIAIQNREAGLERRFEANKMKLMYLLMREIGSRLLKPQRLIHLSTEEEKARAHLSWQMYDYSLYLISFAPIEELAQYVLKPEMVREFAKDCVIVHSDQIPFLAKVRPGKQLYADFEVQGKRWKAERAENKKAIDAKHHQEGSCNKRLPGDHEEDAGKQQIDSDGMAHLRGEATDNNDKYRITVDCEQVFYNVCDSSKPVKAGWGVVSVTMTGSHCDLSNVSMDRTWLRDQTCNYNGREVHYKAGEKLHSMQAKALLDSRDQHPELWQRMRDVGIEIYLQPAGFEDGIITKWKIEKQGQRFAVSIGVRDLFGGCLADSTKQAQNAISQLASHIAGKMGCALQLTDTDVAMRLKNRSAYELQDLRLELHKLAEAEGTRAIFRCGTYEVLRALTGAIEKLKADMDEDDAMLKAGHRNGWLNIRPCLSSGGFISCSSEEWAQGDARGQPPYGERLD